MKRNQLILAISAAVFAIILFIALLASPRRDDSDFRWTPPVQLTITPTLRVTIELLPSPTAQLTTPQPPVQVTESIPTPEPVLITPSPTAAQVSAQEFYVAPDGREDGNGSKEQPWPLQYALDHPEQVQPGDTIWVSGGEYRGSFTSHLQGEEGQPITVRAVPGERAIWMSDDRVLDIATSHYVNFWGIEITATQNSRDPLARPETAYGVRINQGRDSHHIKFINLIVHDMAAQGFGWWMANKDSEIYGSLVYYNGVNQFDHGIYVMNETGTKQILDNFVFDNASHGIHAYGERRQYLNNLHIEGNTVFNNGSIGFTTTAGVYGRYKRNILVGGLNVAENPVIINNYTYFPGQSGEALNLGYHAGSSNAVVENNYFAGGRIQLAGDNAGADVMENTIMGLGATALGILPTSDNQWFLFKPTELKIFIRPNRYEARRANVTIYNWGHQEQVVLTANDLNGIDIQAGDTYELRNVQDYFEDVVTGTYDGEQIVVPMTGHTVAQPLGLNFKPASTFPEFGAFVLTVNGK